MTNLDLYDIVIDNPHNIHMRHRYKLCDWTINAMGVADRPFALPLDTIIRQCTEHDATCAGLPAAVSWVTPRVVSDPRQPMAITV